MVAAILFRSQSCQLQFRILRKQIITQTLMASTKVLHCLHLSILEKLLLVFELLLLRLGRDAGRALSEGVLVVILHRGRLGKCLDLDCWQLTIRPSGICNCLVEARLCITHRILERLLLKFVHQNAGVSCVLDSNGGLQQLLVEAT